MLILLSGCGGGSSSQSKTQFVREANAICEQAEQQRFKRMEAASRKFPSGDLKQVPTQEKMLAIGISAYEDAAQELGSLRTPDGDQEKVEAIIHGLEEGARKVREAPSTLLVSNYPFRRVDGLLKAYGIVKCVIE